MTEAKHETSEQNLTARVSEAMADYYARHKANIKVTTAEDSDRKKRRTANRISFGIEQLALCTFSDPITDGPINTIGQRLLNPFFGSDYKPTYAEGGYGEIVGDLAGTAVYAASQTFLPGFTDFYRASVNKVTHHYYARQARNAVEKGDSVEHAAEMAARRQHEIADSLYFSALCTVGVVGAQKAMKNESPLISITVSKLLGTGLTLGIFHLLRGYAPGAMKWMDNTLSKYLVQPIVGGFQKITGMDKLPEEPSEVESPKPNAFAMAEKTSAKTEVINGKTFYRLDEKARAQPERAFSESVTRRESLAHKPRPADFSESITAKSGEPAASFGR